MNRISFIYNSLINEVIIGKWLLFAKGRNNLYINKK